MNLLQFRNLHRGLKVCVQRLPEFNPIASDTDPTQDIPIKSIELAGNGEPINVRNFKAIYSNLPVEKFTTIEKRHNDSFDQLGELQDLTKKASSSMTTDYQPPKKEQKKHEI